MKAIVFDFDGTLTKKNQNIWRMLWEKCGYTTDKNSLYAKLYKMHVIDKKITRQQWFDYTCKAFKEKGLTLQDIIATSKQIELIGGFEETIFKLFDKGYSLHIVSGCLKETIEFKLGTNAILFDGIETNRCIFDKDGKLQRLVPTDFDYEGKAKYLQLLIQQGYKPEDIIFVGNSDNDEWAHSAGCHTICINPENAEENNSQKWNKVYKNVSHLSKIFSHLDIFDKNQFEEKTETTQSIQTMQQQSDEIAEI